MNHFIEALNHPVEAYTKSLKKVSWGLVIFTILINSVFEPTLQHFWGIDKPEFDIQGMLRITCFGVLSYISICFAFWFVCKWFGSNRTLKEHIEAWGILLNIVFGGILIWKTILFFIYLKIFANLKGMRFFATCAIMGIVILILAFLNGYIGVKSPVL